MRWLTCQAGASGFWTGVLDSLHIPDIGAPPAAGRRAPDAALGRGRLRALADVILAWSRPVTLVVDGYDMVSAELAHEVDLLVRHTGDCLRLVLASRVDPALPLYRYRLEAALTEIRAADLAFTDAEAAELLRAGGVSPSRGAVHSLNQRVGGWGAGLRFAARILAVSEGTDASVAALIAADPREGINEYLFAQVLNTHTSRASRSCWTPASSTSSSQA